MSNYRLLFCLPLLLACPAVSAEAAADNGAALLQKADSLYRAGDFDKAVEVYRQSAEEGNAEAQFDIGYAYYTGEGISRDYTSAAMWFKRSARQQFAKAMYNLAYCYMNGRGVPRDYDKAYSLLVESAEKEYKRAQLTLADCFARGVLVEQNEAESNKWRNRAEGKSAENENAEKKNAESPAPKAEPSSAKADTSAASQNSEPSVPNPEPSAQKSEPSVPRSESQKETLSGDFEIEVSIPDTQVGGESAEAPASGQKNVIPGPDDLRRNKAQQASPAAVLSAPALRILYPEDQSMFHTDQIKMKYQLVGNGCADSARIVVMVDGQRQPATRAVRAANTIDVDLPHHDCTVMMYAQNSCGNSEPVTLRLIRETSQFELPKLFVVAVGVGDYNDPKLPKLKLTCKDAQDFAKAIAAKKGLPYEDVQVKLLCDSEATRADIFEAMEWLKQESSPNDVCIFFYAGHGLRDEKDRFYFIPYGCKSDKLYDCFSAADFRNEAEDINGKFIAFVDACYSGALLEGTRSAATSHFVEQLKRSKNGMLLYASSSSDTKSREDESWGNGAFTKALVESLNGAAREEHAEGLSTQELEHFLYKEVRKITDFKQTPIFINPNGIEHFNIFNYEK